MITTITRDRAYEIYGDTNDGTMGGSLIAPDSPLEKWRKELYEKKGLIIANGTIFLQADINNNADSKVFMWSADENPDYPAKTGIPELPTGTWYEL